tara:strand:- start:194 stop:892 length:699 start_codon:yes stop_codon:yes gene_type:complete
MTTCDKVIQDFGHEITVLYYNNAKKGFKFIGDDPEGKVIPVREEVRDRVYNKLGITGYDKNVPAKAWLDKFYLHNRCLLFTSGVWMSETAGIPHALMYKPGAYCNFKMAGMTRLTALTDDASAICVGPDPHGDIIGYYRRMVHDVQLQMDFVPHSELTVVVPTQNMWYNGTTVNAGAPFRITNPGKLKLLKPGYVIEFWLDGVDIEQSITDYVQMWVDQKIILKERHGKNKP